MPPLDLNVRIEPDLLPPLVDQAISFETGASREQTQDPSLCAYEHHGEGWLPSDRGALPAFFEDLIQGKPLPLTFATKSVQDVDTLVAIALFLHRDLAVNPNTPGFVYLVDFVHRQGLASLAHVEESLARFLCMLRAYLPETGLTKQVFSERLSTALGWVREYICNGQLPHLNIMPSPVQVLQTGPNGFVFAQTTGSLVDGWVDLYRQGFLRGFLIQLGKNDRLHVLGARKSPYVAFDLAKAAYLLNEKEATSGEPRAWEAAALWLRGPEAGTLILSTDILKILSKI